MLILYNLIKFRNVNLKLKNKIKHLSEKMGMNLVKMSYICFKNCIVHSNNQTDRMVKNINFLEFRPRKESNARNRNQVLVFRAFLEKFYDFIKITTLIYFETRATVVLVAVDDRTDGP